MTFPTMSYKSTGANFNMRRIALVALYALLATTSAFAQFTSGVQGNVRDSSGANIPNAQMTLTNTATKAQQVGVSDGSGLYRFTNLAPGEYQVSSSAKGFKTTRTQFTLTAGENRDVSLSLSPGGDSTNVIVTSQAPSSIPPIAAKN